MEAFYLIKIGEVLLKLGNQKEFIRRLRQQLNLRLRGIDFEMEIYPGRFFLRCDESQSERVEFVLSHCPGINGYSKAIKCAKSENEILAAATEEALKASSTLGHKFKVETRRSDKSFPLGSYQMSAKAGEIILTNVPGLSVDVNDPDFVVNIEIRERAYVYATQHHGPRGLPSGSSGKGLLLLSGGIDSPVAGYMMSTRGLALEAVYFHAYPFTSDEARKKVEHLAVRVAGWCGSIRLWVVPFTEVQIHIQRNSLENSRTLMLRTAMMDVADRLASSIRATCIITGESLGQVASQTAENLRVSEHKSELPILRPLIGIDKEDTIKMAKRIGTYDISIQPFEDCCSLFAPPHPVLRSIFSEQTAAYKALTLDPLLQKSIAETEMTVFEYKDVLREFGVLP
jgi:thiamine biosynthesis protein ThiI